MGRLSQQDISSSAVHDTGKALEWGSIIEMSAPAPAFGS
jgi:hypothetical protein